jgi:hypothetical protein
MKLNWREVAEKRLFEVRLRCARDLLRWRAEILLDADAAGELWSRAVDAWTLAPTGGGLDADERETLERIAACPGGAKDAALLSFLEAVYEVL